MRAPVRLSVLSLVLATACASPGLPEGHGPGLVSFDRAPPAGVATYPRPTWQAGDRFVYRRGGIVRLPYRVLAPTETGYVLEQEETTDQVHLTRDLGASAETTADGTALRVQEPADVLLHWPLWVGKRWSCQFVRKVPGAAIGLTASYRCDAVETIDVPAGRFECLRIWRRLRVAAPGRYQERVALLWYAPEVGYFARRLENGTLLDLESFHRQSAGS